MTPIETAVAPKNDPRDTPTEPRLIEVAPMPLSHSEKQAAEKFAADLLLSQADKFDTLDPEDPLMSQRVKYALGVGAMFVREARSLK